MDSHRYQIVACSYKGYVVPLLFSPPALLRRVEEATSSSSFPAFGSLVNQTGAKPSWIHFSSRRNDSKRNDEQLMYITDESSPGRLFVAKIVNGDGNRDKNDKSFSLQMCGEPVGYPTGGDGPVASNILGNTLFIANYDSGSYSEIPLHSDNGLPIAKSGPSKVVSFKRPKGDVGPVPSRQDKSYVHDVVASPDGRWVYLPDLGTDEIHLVLCSRETENDKSLIHTTLHASIQVPSGSGPRHIAFFKDETAGTEGSLSQYAYLVCELACTVIAYEQDPTTGDLRMIDQPVSCIPPNMCTSEEAERSRASLATDPKVQASVLPSCQLAELVISPDGKFIYVSSRGNVEGKEDHINVFARDPATGRIRLLMQQSSGGRWPRHICLSDDGRFLLVANQYTGNILVFARDAQNGTLQRTGAEISDIPQVAFASFVQ